MPAVVVEDAEWVLCLFIYWDLQGGGNNQFVLSWSFFHLVQRGSNCVKVTDSHTGW